jgi:hypothetical protein
MPWNRAETNIDFVNNWTKILHNHTIKFGVDVRRLRDELLQTQDAGGPRGEFQFRNNQTSTPGAAVLDLIARLNRERGTAAIMATHSAEAAGIATRVVRLRDGRIESDSAQPSAS